MWTLIAVMLIADLIVIGGALRILFVGSLISPRRASAANTSEERERKPAGTS